MPLHDRYQVSVLLTEQCNMRCRYCTTAKRDGDMSSEVIGHVVRLLETTEPSGLDLNFHGGEPTAHWDGLVELAERLKPTAGRRRVSYNMSTNGTYIDAGRARWLAELGVDVRVSIDGRPKAHVANRRDRFDKAMTMVLYERSLEGLDHLVAAGVDTSVNMVVTPDTVGDLLENAVFLLDRGLVHLITSPVVGTVWHDEALLELDRQLRLVMGMWHRWFRHADARRREQLRRSLLSEVQRSKYCAGMVTNQPDCPFYVFAPDGRVLGDEPEYRVEDRLLIARIDEVAQIDDLPRLPRTAFQLMWDLGFYKEPVLVSVRRTHMLLKNRMAELYEQLYGQPAALAPRL